MEQSESIKELATALAKAQGQFEAVPLNAINPFLHNRYADLGSVIETAKPVLSGFELSVSQLVSNDEGGISVTTILMHSSGEWMKSTLSLPIGDEKGKSLAQVAGSIITYLRRYAYGAILGLYTGDDDDDGGNAEKKAASEKAVAAIHPNPESPEEIEAKKKLDAMGLKDFQYDAMLKSSGGSYAKTLSLAEKSQATLDKGKKALGRDGGGID